MFLHRKKRNSGLIYEFLVRHLASLVIEGSKDEYAKTLVLIEKYFKTGEVLSEELEIFNVLNKNKGCSPIFATKLLKQIDKNIGKLDKKLLEIKKSNLLKDINYTFGKEFFNKYRLSEYKNLATIQLYIDNKLINSQSLTECVDRVKLEEGLISLLTRTKIIAKPAFNPEADGLVFSVAQKKFESKYGSLLSPKQKNILNSYANLLTKGDRRLVNEFIIEEKANIVSKLISLKNVQEVLADKEMNEKLTKAINQLKELKSPDSDFLIGEMLNYIKLVEELNSNE